MSVGHPSAAWRRHQAERWKKRVRSYFVCAEGTGHDRHPTDDPARIGQMARTPKPCSCWACGSPRKWFGERTVQERRHEAADELWEFPGEP